MNDKNLYRKPQTDTTSIILIMSKENIYFPLDKKTIVNIINIEEKEEPYDWHRRNR